MSAEKYLNRIENRGIGDPFTYSRKEMTDFAEKYAEQLLIQRVVLNEADFVSSDSINNEPEPLWKSHDLELASSEVELPCHCGKLMEEPYAPCCSLSCWCEMFEGQGN